ncbi:MAG: alkylated DNA repair dioxygenase AlkB [Gammaproteobacteria bacterium]|jgi:alkylated DNA repair dioxygenase AlkB|tara:strand:- start:4014 stop:4601 length:588 start_codon:yes stop_codon:yes gene_type:complete
MHKESVEGYQDLEIDIWQLNQNELQISQWTQDCLDEINWIAGVIKMFGKEHKIPRLQAWYADKDINYSYSGKILIRNNWNAILKEIKDHIELITLGKFNSVLANLYRDGNDSMGMHADDEKELGQKPIIVSLSLGEKRDLFFKHKYKDISFSIPQESGSLVVMKGTTQEFWKHGIKKTKKIKKQRINLTFRNIIS